jgi:hypothetical protein
VALITSERLLPRELVEALIQTSPSDLRGEPFGPLLLLVELPEASDAAFGQTLEQHALRGAPRLSLPSTGFATTELPTLQRDPDEVLEADQVGLLAELAVAPYCALPLSPAGTRQIGRARTNSIVLRDSSVSQTHAELSVQEDCVSLVDLSSKNGTWVNGVRLTPGVPRWLQAMDRLQWGRVRAFTCTAPVLRSVLRHQLRQLL